MAILKPKISSYIVKKGDCLWNIAKSQYGDPTVWPEISKANSLSDPHLILVKQILKLPTIQKPDLPSVEKPSKIRTKSLATGLQQPTYKSHHPVPGSQPQTIGTTTQSSKLSSTIAKSVAKSVKYPAFSYKVDFLSIKINYPPPVRSCELKLTGNITFQKKGTIGNIVNTNIEFSKVGGQAKFQADADMAYSNLRSSMAFRFNKSRTPEVSYGFAVAVKVNGEVISTNKYEITTSGCLKFTSKTREIKGEIKGKFGDFDYKFVFGYEVKICFSSTSTNGRVVIASEWVALLSPAGGDPIEKKATLDGDICPQNFSDDTISFTEVAKPNNIEANITEMRKMPKGELPGGGLLRGGLLRGVLGFIK